MPKNKGKVSDMAQRIELSFVIDDPLLTFMLESREEKTGDEERTRTRTTSVNLCSRKRAKSMPK
jgi:hypothetical protein